MKLNRGMVLAAALVVGSAAVVGCSRPEGEDSAGAAAEQASVTGGEGASEALASNEGFEQDARFAHHRPGFRAGEHAGWRRGEHAGFRRGERWREHHRPWWRFW